MTGWLLYQLYRRYPGQTAAAMIGLLSLISSGCTHTNSLTRRGSTPDEAVVSLRGQSPAGFPAPAGTRVAPGVVRLNRGAASPTSLASQTDRRPPTGSSDIQSVGFDTFAQPCPPQLYPPCPRTETAFGPGCPSCPPAQPCPVIVNGPGVVAWDPTQYPDEYLCDGGDRGMPFHYEGRQLGGLETEDTIAEAYDITGKKMVVPSSKVCIYAPRFGGLRTISGLATELDIQQATGAHDGIRVAGIDTHLNIDEQTQRDQLLQFDVRSRASSADMNMQQAGLHQDTSAFLHQQQWAAFQNLMTLHEGEFQQADLAVLSYGVQNASVWTRDEFPVLYAHDARGAELEVEFNAAEYVGTEDRRTPGLLKVVKLADKEIARPGDEITFTIRFANAGQRELLGIRIVDNLTPRLAYIDGSADSAFAGQLDIEPNGEGSSILTFRLDKPLQGQTSGEISFRCRVR
ncbi:MAG: hypothetical protein ACK5Q5_08960 [Planctomycetaceae bacterium]